MKKSLAVLKIYFFVVRTGEIRHCAYGEGFRLKNIQIRRTFSWKIACILATLPVNFIFSGRNLQRIWEVGRGWGD